MVSNPEKNVSAFVYLVVSKEVTRYFYSRDELILLKGPHRYRTYNKEAGFSQDEKSKRTERKDRWKEKDTDRGAERNSTRKSLSFSDLTFEIPSHRLC